MATTEETTNTPSQLTTFGSSCLYKLLSGRFILTIVGALCFYKLTQCVTSILVEKAKEIAINEVMLIISNILLVLSNIFTFYFVKATLENKPTGGKVTNGNGGSEGNGSTNGNGD